MRGVTRRELSVGLMASLASTRLAAKAGAPDWQQVVVEAASTVRSNYVDAGTASRAADLLLSNLRRGVYRAYATPSSLAARLTADLRGVSNDKHFAVRYEPATLTAADKDVAAAEDDIGVRFINFGIQSASRLAGNIGLLKITHFLSPAENELERYGAAFTLLHDTDALILDLTENHGGGEDTAALLVSYFVDGQVELGRILFRNDPPQITTTRAQVTGPRYGHAKPLYIAVSPVTFSAGEAVTYQLRHLTRATVVGQRTRGGAHPGLFFKLPGNFKIFVSTGRLAGTDWEGDGIEPDIKADDGQALETAYETALNRLLTSATDEKKRRLLNSIIAGKNKEMSGQPL